MEKGQNNENVRKVRGSSPVMDVGGELGVV